MPSERVQRQIDRLLDEAEAAITALDWDVVRDRATAVLTLDDGNADALTYLASSEKGLAGQPTSAGDAAPTQPAPATEAPTQSAQAQPTSFAGGRYEVRRFLGEGGKKRVYLAHDVQLDRDVAFALIKTEGLDDAARVRITREAQAMGRLGSHPHIVTVYDIGEENGQPYLVLPVLPGGDVEGIIEQAEDHKLSIEQAVKIATETCMGLEFSHLKGIIHRDLKPGNIWLAEDGRAMIGDFGLAVAVDRSRLTQAGMMVGTVSYMPPEQAMGGEVTPQSDLYSLGAMLYEMVCGRPPFVGDEHVAIIGQHLNTPPVAPTWHRPDCPPGLEALILRLLEKDASKRPASATEVREALSSVEQGASVSTEAPAPAQPAYDPLYRRTFVGRENETRQLHQAYDASVSGQGGLVMVAGEPGIGKTALCEQLETYVSLRGGKTLFGHCYEEGSHSLPYLAFVEAMRTYVLARDPEPLRSELGTGAGEVARIVSEVRDKVQVELRDVSDPEDDRWRLLNAITTFLRNASNVQPLVIVLEDLHWSDRGTLDLLLHLARNLEGARLLVVGTYRDVEVDRQHPLSATLADLRRINTFLRIPLRGLTVDEVHRMYEVIRGNAVPRPQSEAVFRATEGNPLFVQEILRYLVEEGLVVRQDGQYVATPGVTIPEGLRDVVGRRLGHLSEKANQVLSIASVIGRDFRLDVLQQVAGMPEDEVQGALEEATERSIIEERQSVGSLAFRFGHAFFRQVLYEEIFAARQIRWHQQVARALEQAYGQRTAEHAAELAEHYSHSTDADDLRKAVDFGRTAANRAMSVFAYGEAVGHLEQAIQAQEILDPDEHESACDLFLALGDALIPGNDPIRARDYAALNAFEHAVALDDRRRAFEACRVGLDGGQVAQGALVGLEWQAWLDRAEPYQDVSQAARVRVSRSKAIQLASNGKMGEATAMLEGSLAVARSTDSAEAEATVGWMLGAFYKTSGEYLKAHRLSEELFALRHEGVSVRNLSSVLVDAILSRNAIGERVRAQEALGELQGLAERTKDPSVIAAMLVGEAREALMDGRLEDVSILAERVREFRSVTPIALDPLRAQSELMRGGLGRVALPEGGPSAVHMDIIRAWGLALDGQSLEAGALLRQALSGTDGRFGFGYRLAILLWALQVAIVLEDGDTITSLLQELAPQSPFLDPIGAIGRYLGDAAVFMGSFEKARDYYLQAITLCEKVSHRPELAVTRAHLAELLLDHYPDERDPAIEHLDFAIAEFQAMKMQPALERALGRRGLLKA